MPFLPHAARDPGFFVDARPNARDALSQFDLVWRYPVQVVLFFFGLVNAGVPLHALEPGTWGLPIAVIVGKPIGVLLGAGAALAVGLHLPHKVGWRELLVVSFTAAIGFNIGLFICGIVARRSCGRGRAWACSSRCSASRSRSSRRESCAWDGFKV
jgi:NhaA family Na+:H+ antiporter